MSLDLCASTRDWIERSASRQELMDFSDWLEAERYSSFVADQHLRRMAFMLERLSPDGKRRVYSLGQTQARLCTRVLSALSALPFCRNPSRVQSLSARQGPPETGARSRSACRSAACLPALPGRSARFCTLDSPAPCDRGAGVSFERAPTWHAPSPCDSRSRGALHPYSEPGGIATLSYSRCRGYARFSALPISVGPYE